MLPGITPVPPTGPIGYRYFRINTTTVQTADAVAIDELELMIAGVDQIPAMTGGTTSGVTATASANAGSGFEPWRAANNSTASYWVSSSSPPQWLQFAFPSPLILTSYSIQAPSINGAQIYAPKTFTLQGSDTGSFSGEQVTLNTQTGLANWTAGEKRTFTI